MLSYVGRVLCRRNWSPWVPLCLGCWKTEVTALDERNLTTGALVVEPSLPFLFLKIVWKEMETRGVLCQVLTVLLLSFLSIKMVSPQSLYSSFMDVALTKVLDTNCSSESYLTHLLKMYWWQLTLILYLQTCLLWDQVLFKFLKQNMEQRDESLPWLNPEDTLSVHHPEAVSPCEQWVGVILSTMPLSELCYFQSRAGSYPVSISPWGRVYRTSASHSCPPLQVKGSE